MTSQHAKLLKPIFDATLMNGQDWSLIVLFCHHIDKRFNSSLTDKPCPHYKWMVYYSTKYSRASLTTRWCPPLPHTDEPNHYTSGPFWSKYDGQHTDHIPCTRYRPLGCSKAVHWTCLYVQENHAPKYMIFFPTLHYQAQFLCLESHLAHWQTISTKHS